MSDNRTVTQLNLRIPQELAHALQELAQAEHLEKIDIARQLLWEGVARRKQELAVRLYTQGKVTKSRAAEIAGLSLWEMVDLVQQRGVRWEYSLDEAKAEVETVLRKGHRQGRKSTFPPSEGTHRV